MSKAGEPKSYFVSVAKKTTKHEPEKGGDVHDFKVNGEELKQLHYEPLFAGEKGKLLKHYEDELFLKILTLFKSGNNVIIGGSGSKKPLLARFAQQCLENGHHLVIDGCVDELRQRLVVAALVDALNCKKGEEEDLIMTATKLRREFYLIIHSVDRLFANSSRSKATISRLITSSPRIHLIASVDHVNSGLLWTFRETELLRLLWLNCSTFQEYSCEVKYAQMSINRITGYNKLANQQVSLSAITSVFDKLNSNAQKIFIMILNYYKQNFLIRQTRQRKVPKEMEETDSEDEEKQVATKASEESSNFEGYPFNHLLVDCMYEFVVNSEATLRAQLVEFRSHELIRTKIGKDGSEYVELLIQDKMIPKLIEELEQRI